MAGVSSRRRVRRILPSVPPDKMPRGWRAKRRVHAASSHPPSREGVAPLGAPSQRRYGAGPRFLTFRFGFASGSETLAPFGRPCLRTSGKPDGPPSARSWQGVVVPPGGAPAPPERVRCVIPTPAGAASGPAVMTPHESALGGPDLLNLFLDQGDIATAPKIATASRRIYPRLGARRLTSGTAACTASRAARWRGRRGTPRSRGRRACYRARAARWRRPRLRARRARAGRRSGRAE